MTAAAHALARKAFVDRFTAALEAGGDRATRLAQLYAPDVSWHGSHPLNDIRGCQALIGAVWQPLLEAIPDLQRVDDVVVAGSWRDGDWIAATGHLVGRFVHDWLGIRATGKVVGLRYGEYSRLQDGRIAECYVIFDILDLLRQCGIWPLAPALGCSDRVPASMTQDGVWRTTAIDEESTRSLKLVEAMIAGLMRYDGVSLDSMDQASFWHRDFMWYGPAGIGTCRGQDDYRRVHQGPFLRAFPDRVGGNHKCRIAEGVYVASTGWPSIKATHAGGGFLGLPPTGRAITMRVMDFWRRDGELLRENWVFIDLLDLLKQMGFDVLARMRAGGLLASPAPGHGA